MERQETGEIWKKKYEAKKEINISENGEIWQNKWKNYDKNIHLQSEKIYEAKNMTRVFTPGLKKRNLSKKGKMEYSPRG